MLYTIGEEIFNSITHGIGAALSIAALVVMIVFASINGARALDIIGYVIYGLSLIILYTMSTLYHAITNEKAKKVLRVIDHSSVYILISGSITPYVFTVLNETDHKRWIVFATVWSVTLLGIVLYAIFKQKVKVFNVISYVFMGWSVIFLFPELMSTFNLLNIMPCIYLLVSGGIAYTLGLVFYGLKKFKYFHSIWHLFVLVGSILHFISLMIYILK